MQTMINHPKKIFLREKLNFSFFCLGKVNLGTFFRIYFTLFK